MKTVADVKNELLKLHQRMVADIAQDTRDMTAAEAKKDGVSFYYKGAAAATTRWAKDVSSLIRQIDIYHSDANTEIEKAGDIIGLVFKTTCHDGESSGKAGV